MMSPLCQVAFQTVSERIRELNAFSYELDLSKVNMRNRPLKSPESGAAVWPSEVCMLMGKLSSA